MENKEEKVMEYIDVETVTEEEVYVEVADE